jgi:hypothetical protein
MAVATGLQVKNIQSLGVTIHTLDGLAKPVQAMPGQAESAIDHMIKGLVLPQRRSPAHRRMASRTITWKQPRMDLGFRMAILALGSRLIPGLPRQGYKELRCSRVAFGTSQVSMLALQREIRSGMVKLGQAILTIMAGNASAPVFSSMSLHELRIMSGMAGDALLRQGAQYRGKLVAILTFQGEELVIQLVHQQAE